MEYIILLIEFIKIKTGNKSSLKKLFKLLTIPLLITLLIFYFGQETVFEKINNCTITVLGILIGFSISMFAILLTSSNDNINKSKQYKLGFKLGSKDIYLFDKLIVSLAYIIVIESVLLIFNILYPIFTSPETTTFKWLFSVSIAILIHVIITTIRTILDFYFTVTKK